MTHSLNSNAKAISKHRGLRMPSQQSGGGIPGLFRLLHDGVTGPIAAFTSVLDVSGAAWWSSREAGCESEVMGGVKGVGGGGIDSPCINSTRRLCHSSGYTSSLRNAASLQSKHGVTSSALTQGALLSGGVVKNKGAAANLAHRLACLRWTRAAGGQEARRFSECMRLVKSTHVYQCPRHLKGTEK